MSEDAVEPAVRALYDAAADAARWPAALAAVAEAVGADLVRFLIWDDRRDEAVLSATHGAGPRDETPCVARHDASDPRRRPVGRITARHDSFDEAFVRRDPCCREVSVPADFRHVAGIRLTAGHGRTAVLGIHRTKRRGPFAAGDRARIEALTPHVRWAAEMHRRLAPTAEAASVALRALDGINAPLAVVDAEARVLLANRAASGVLAAGDGLSLWGERLTIAEPAAAASLRRVLRAAFAAAAGLASEGGGQIVVPRPSGRRAYALLATPLPETADLAAGRPAVLLHLVDPESRRRFASVNLRRLYGLTAAEADLAAGLLHGLRLEDFAEERGVRLTTVRTQLRALFEKTDTNRQPELVRLLTRLTLLRDATEERPCYRPAPRRAGAPCADDWRAGLPAAALPAGAPSGAGRLGMAGAAP